MRANRAILGLGVLVLLAAGCGSSDDSTPVTVTPTTAPDAYATTVPAVTTTQASYSTTTAATTATTAATATATTLPPTTTVPPDTGPRTVTVEAGDSLSQIAKDNGMSLDDLAAINAICDTNQLFVGQVLLLSAEETGDPDAEPSERTVTVQSGDSLSKIAKRHDTTVEALMADNDIDDPNTIFVGQELTVSSDAPATPIEDPCS
tara:strand:+ start:6276 stop:6890 length:615 start_codon:yes stop_codon:yes gene_type:complete